MAFPEDLYGRGNVAVQVALKILIDVAPSILDSTVPLPRRVALARTWVQVLCNLGNCPGNVPENPREWGIEHLDHVAKSLVDVATRILSAQGFRMAMYGR